MAESVPGESAARARRHIRRDMENNLTKGSRQFLEAFGEVDQVCPFIVYLAPLYLCILLARNWMNYRNTSMLCESVVMKPSAS